MGRAGCSVILQAASAIDELLEPWLGSGKLADRHPSSCERRSSGRGRDAWEGRGALSEHPPTSSTT